MTPRKVSFLFNTADVGNSQISSSIIGTKNVQFYVFKFVSNPTLLTKLTWGLSYMFHYIFVVKDQRWRVFDNAMYEANNNRNVGVQNTHENDEV